MITGSQRLGFCLLLAAVAVGAVAWLRSTPGAGVLVFSERDMLASLWRGYKEEYLEAGTGRAIDRQREDVTTSEGQSYTMLRAAWMDDRETFDRAFKWTEDNLGRDGDALYSWLFGRRADGTYGVLVDRGGYNSATDADADIAFALLLAHERWGDGRYLEAAKETISSIWEKDVLVVNGRPIVLANDLEARSSAQPIVNPSYLAPYAYRAFAAVDEDPTHDWEGAVDAAYEILASSTLARLDRESSAGLPPDWVAVSRSTGAPLPTGVEGLSTSYGFDAMRVPWRIALDYRWTGDRRARAYLERLGFLGDEWREKGALAAVYAHDGAVLDPSESAAAYGGAIGYFMVAEPALAGEIFERKLRSLYDQDRGDWRTPLGYYDANWAWFGIALHAGLLDDFGLVPS